MSDGRHIVPGLTARAPAKVNLTLHVLGRRADGYHELESLVAFAGAADTLTLRPGGTLALTVAGPTAGAAGPPEKNLVLRASRALASRRSGLRLGAFHLIKRLPAAAGIGGGSSDAAAALRLLAAANDLPVVHPDVVAAARATGADVPVCLDPRARVMGGAGEEVGPPLGLPLLFAVLVNPGVAVPTADVFQALGLAPGKAHAPASPSPEGRAESRAARTGVGSRGRRILESGSPRDEAASSEGLARRNPHPGSRFARLALPSGEGKSSARSELMGALSAARNDLQAPALALAPAIGDALRRLRGTAGCRLARMSGSGATVFGLYDDCRAASVAARAIRAAEPGWWVRPTVLR